MSNTTITLQQHVNFCSTHADLLPLSNVGGYTNEPALSLCNDAISELLSTANDWKVNRAEMPFFVTCPNRQDQQFAGATIFSLGSTSQGWGIDLASNSAITVTAGTVTVNTLENHRFAVADTIYMNGVTMTTGTTSAYNSTFTDNGSTSVWSGGWVITAVGTKSVSFAKTAGQANSDVGGAPGITDFGWASSASMVELNNNSSPQNIAGPLIAYRELPVTSRISTPDKVSVLVNNGDGTLKIRMHNVPGTPTLAVSIVYQKQAPLKVALTDNWAPFTDDMSGLTRQALLYRMYRYINSPRAEVEYAKLQQEILKFQSSDDAETTDTTLSAECLMDNSYWGW